MTQTPSIYDSARLAAHYAYDRPAVHARIIQAIGQRLNIATRVGRALDIGCGAGLSTAALEPLAAAVVGIEPVRAMLAHSRVVAPRALFVVGRGERLPFAAAVFDLITAAGSINYTHRDSVLAEVARVLAPGGSLVIYDFSAGRRLRADRHLEEWFASFERRYPSPAGYELDVRGLDFASAGLRLFAYDQREVAVSMNLASYLSYALGEINVEAAIVRGVPEAEIRDWCQGTLADVFGDESRDVLFDSYLAYVTRG